MAELNFDTGLKEYSLNGKVTVSFNPTDTNFIERIFNTFDTLDKLQNERVANIKDDEENGKVFDSLHDMDAQMRELIDGIFNVPVCDAVFGDMNLYAAANGLPIWCNMLLAIIDEMDTVFAQEKAATNPRIQKYTAKYTRK